MFSLERLLIAFSAFLGDSISKTPKVHALVCLCAFGLLAVGMVLVEIEHDVFKLWVRVFVSFFSRGGISHRIEDISHHRDLDDVFLSSFSRSSEEQLAGQKQKRARTRDRGKSSFDASFRPFLLFIKTPFLERRKRENEMQFSLLFPLIFSQSTFDGRDFPC